MAHSAHCFSCFVLYCSFSEVSLFSLCLWTLRPKEAVLVSPLTPSTRLACKNVSKKTLQKFDFVKVIFQSGWKIVPLPRGFIFSGGDLSIFNYVYTTVLNSWTLGGVDLMLCHMETQLIYIPYLHLLTPPPNAQLPHWLHLWLQTMYMDLHLLFYFNTISWLPCFDRRLIMFSFSLLPFTVYPFPFFYLCQDWLD